jgi:hypothetical protein
MWYVRARIVHYIVHYPLSYLSRALLSSAQRPACRRSNPCGCDCAAARAAAAIAAASIASGPAAAAAPAAGPAAPPFPLPPLLLPRRPPIPAGPSTAGRGNDDAAPAHGRSAIDARLLGAPLVATAAAPAADVGSRRSSILALLYMYAFGRSDESMIRG